MMLKKIIILALLDICCTAVKNHKNTPVAVPQLEFQNSLHKVHFEWPENQKWRNVNADKKIL